MWLQSLQFRIISKRKSKCGACRKGLDEPKDTQTFSPWKNGNSPPQPKLVLLCTLLARTKDRTSHSGSNLINTLQIFSYDSLVVLFKNVYTLSLMKLTKKLKITTNDYHHK